MRIYIYRQIDRQLDIALRKLIKISIFYEKYLLCARHLQLIKKKKNISMRNRKAKKKSSKITENNQRLIKPYRSYAINLVKQFFSGAKFLFLTFLYYKVLQKYDSTSDFIYTNYSKKKKDFFIHPPNHSNDIENSSTN